MRNWGVYLLCVIPLLCFANEPDEGGIGGTGRTSFNPETEEMIHNRPEVPEVIDQLEVPEIVEGVPDVLEQVVPEPQIDDIIISVPNDGPAPAGF